MIKAIITDIEGTTSSISFVKDVLFPYARTHIENYLQTHHHEPPIQDLIAEVIILAGKPLPLNSLIEQLQQWMDEDQKITPLKALQGLIWEEGYRRGDFTGHIYPDAIDNLKKWHANGIDLYIYSSGSVHAQKLLFAHTEHGDITPLFSDYFDTQIGNKKDMSSYYKIADQLALPTDQLLFLSDSIEELDAAKAAGFNTLCLVRDGEIPTLTTHRQASNFDQISIASFNS